LEPYPRSIETIEGEGAMGEIATNVTIQIVVTRGIQTVMIVTTIEGLLSVRQGELRRADIRVSGGINDREVGRA